MFRADSNSSRIPSEFTNQSQKSGGNLAAPTSRRSKVSSFISKIVSTISLGMKKVKTGLVFSEKKIKEIGSSSSQILARLRDICSNLAKKIIGSPKTTKDEEIEMVDCAQIFLKTPEFAHQKVVDPTGEIVDHTEG